MRLRYYYRQAVGSLLTVLLLVFGTTGALAAIQGITGPSFQLSAKTGVLQASDGEAFLMWGYADTSPGGYQKMQYPGPTLLVNQGDVVTITLTNNLPAAAGNTSIVFPGQTVTATGGVAGLLTNEAVNGGSVTYQFTATHPGTYLYRSGTRPDLQVEMGLVGAIVVYPSAPFNDGQHAYNHEDSRFDREFLLVITEMDPTIHRAVEYGEIDLIDTSAYYPTNWFANGRNFPDDLSDDFVPWLPHQPYKFNPRLHPGEHVLVRSVAVGNQIHPFHYHGNDFEVIGMSGRMLSSGPGMGADLAWQAATRRTIPGQTADVMWTWNAEQLGWDIYGHEPGKKYPYDPEAWDPDDPDTYPPEPIDPNTYICGLYDPNVEATFFDPVTREYCPDHGDLFPVILPTRDSLSFGPFYAGTPFLGGEGELAPGDAGLNATAGYFYMWHSHTEKELTSNDIWPGGLVTFAIVEHPAVPLP